MNCFILLSFVYGLMAVFCLEGDYNLAGNISLGSMKQLQDETDCHIIPVNGDRSHNKIKRGDEIKSKTSVERVKIPLKKVYLPLDGHEILGLG